MSDPRARLAPAIDRLRFSRRTTETFLADLVPGDWLWQPGDGLNHIAWHVGHVTYAQYFLCVVRVRGRIESDRDLVPTAFLRRYKFGSRPSANPARNATPDELLATLRGVHELALAELERRTDADLVTPAEPAHPLFETTLGGVEWCSQHELIHCGQMMLLRRMLGKPALWKM
ncbi:MAG: DinB family protein [Planctomycetota bacterium]